MFKRVGVVENAIKCSWGGKFKIQIVNANNY